MDDGDLYRRNPARDLEQLALELVRSWLGERGEVKDTSAGHDPDFRISYVDGRTAWGEVGWHQDPLDQEMWAATFQQKQHQTVALQADSGLWSVHIARGSSIKRLHQGLPDLARRLAEAGVDRLEVQESWPRTELAGLARRLGIEYMARVASVPDAAIYFFGPGGGVIPQDPNVITEWIDAVVEDPDYADLTRKLLGRDADERHIFVMSGTRTSFGADERLRRIATELPSRPPCVPQGITHVWVIARFGSTHAGLWTRGGTWSAVPLPE